jgi:hypothetical protein
MNEELVKELNKMVYAEEESAETAPAQEVYALDPDLYVDNTTTNESTLFKYLTKKFNISEAIETPAAQIQKPGIEIMKDGSVMITLISGRTQNFNTIADFLAAQDKTAIAWQKLILHQARIKLEDLQKQAKNEMNALKKLERFDNVDNQTNASLLHFLFRGSDGLKDIALDVDQSTGKALMPKTINFDGDELHTFVSELTAKEAEQKAFQRKKEIAGEQIVNPGTVINKEQKRKMGLR